MSLTVTQFNKLFHLFFVATTNDVNIHVYIHWENGIGNGTSLEDQLVVLVLNYGTEPVVIEPKSFYQSHPGFKSETPPDKRIDYVVTSDDLQSKNVWINGKKAEFPETGIPSSLSYGLEATSPNATMSLPGHSYAFYQFLHFGN